LSDVWPSLQEVRPTVRRPEFLLPDWNTVAAYLRCAVLRERLVVITAAATAQLQAGVPAKTLFGKQHAYDLPKFFEVLSCFHLAARVPGAGAVDVEDVCREALWALEAVGAVSGERGPAGAVHHGPTLRLFAAHAAAIGHPVTLAPGSATLASTHASAPASANASLPVGKPSDASASPAVEAQGAAAEAAQRPSPLSGLHAALWAPAAGARPGASLLSVTVPPSVAGEAAGSERSGHRVLVIAAVDCRCAAQPG
jgi:hypothetical protein